MKKNIVAELDIHSPIPAGSIWRGNGVVDFEMGENEPEPVIRKLHIRREKQEGGEWVQKFRDKATKLKSLARKERAK